MIMSDSLDTDISDSNSFTPRRVVQNSRFGVVRTCGSLNRMEITFLLASTLSLLATLVLSIYKLATITTTKENSDFFFAILIIVNVLFCIYYAIYGIYWERSFEILVFCIAVVIFIAYLIANFVTTKGWNDDIKIGRLVVAALLAPVCGALGAIIAKDFYNQNNLIVRTVGAASEFASACKLLFTLQAALKLDMQMGISFLVLILAKDIETIEIVLLSVGAPCTLIWFLLGMFATRYEIRWLMWLFFPMGLVCGPGYIVYRMYLAYQDISSQNPYTHYIGAVAVACGSVFLLARISALVLAVFVYKNFGRGLRQKLDAPPGTRQQPYRPGGTFSRI